MKSAATNTIGIIITATAFCTGCGGGANSPPEQTKRTHLSNAVDNRDGKSYGTVTIGGQTWMAENMNYNAPNSKCYANKEDNCARHGRLYNWNQALNACPAGWHLPNNDEWGALENYAGGSEAAGAVLKSPAGWNNNGGGTDTYGFSAAPGGYARSGGIFYGGGSYGYWWTSTEKGPAYAIGRYMFYNYGRMSAHDVNKSFLFSVRCIRN